ACRPIRRRWSSRARASGTPASGATTERATERPFHFTAEVFSEPARTISLNAYRGRRMPSLRIRDSSVVRFSPSRAAAPAENPGTGEPRDSSHKLQQHVAFRQNSPRPRPANAGLLRQGPTPAELSPGSPFVCVASGWAPVESSESHSLLGPAAEA